MVDLIRELINLYGPAIGPAIFIAALVITWQYHGLMRKVSLRLSLVGIMLMDKDIVSFKELKEYGILDEDSTSGLKHILGAWGDD